MNYEYLAMFVVAWLLIATIASVMLLVFLKARRLYALFFLALLFWHFIWLFRLPELSSEFASGTPVLAMCWSLFVLVYFIVVILFTERIFPLVWHPDYTISPSINFRASLICYSMLSAAFLLFYIADPNRFATLSIERVRAPDLWVLESLGTYLCAMALGALGYLIGFTLRPRFFIACALCAVFMFLCDGRVMLYTFAGGAIVRWLYASRRMRGVTAAVSLLFILFGGYVAGVLTRELRHIPPEMWYQFIVDGRYNDTLDWRSTESEIYFYLLYVVEHGWKSVVPVPMVSVQRTVLAPAPGSLFPQLKPLDSTQYLWLKVAQDPLQRIRGFEVTDDLLAHPGSVPSTFFGEALLNGGLIGAILFVPMVAVIVVALDRWIRCSSSRFIYFGGIYFTFLIYTARGSYYWGIILILPMITIYCMALAIKPMLKSKARRIQGSV